MADKSCGISGAACVITLIQEWFSVLGAESVSAVEMKMVNLDVWIGATYTVMRTSSTIADSVTSRESGQVITYILAQTQTAWH